MPSEEYGRILVQGEENLKREEEDGRVVAVLEKRAINAHREGYFILQVRGGEEGGGEEEGRGGEGEQREEGKGGQEKSERRGGERREEGEETREE